jgi:hypothetical protein
VGSVTGLDEIPGGSGGTVPVEIATGTGSGGAVGAGQDSSSMMLGKSSSPWPCSTLRRIRANRGSHSSVLTPCALLTAAISSFAAYIDSVDSFAW